MSSITVTRESEDRLSAEEWKFGIGVKNDVIMLNFNRYAKMSRPSTRHKFRADKLWDRYDQRSYHSNLTFRDVPSSPDVIDEAMSNLEFSVTLPAGDIVGWTK